MPDSSPVDQSHFRRMLARNITLPLSAGILNIVLFVALLFALQSGLHIVNHTEEVIAKANELINKGVDMQSGVRGFLLTGDEEFCSPTKPPNPPLPRLSWNCRKW